jgi:hypothetical protein
MRPLRQGERPVFKAELRPQDEAGEGVIVDPTV